LVADLSVAVPPFNALGLNDAQSQELRTATLEILAHDREVTAPEDTDAALVELELEGEALRSCFQDGPCAARVARAAGADSLVVGSAAGLGGTYVLRLALIDAQRAVIDREVQTTVEGSFEELISSLPEQLENLLPLPPPPWYRRWWFWTIIGTVVATAVIVPTVVLLRPQEPTIDEYPLP